MTGVLAARLEGVHAVFRDGKTEAVAGMIRERTGAPIRRMLVVGCGSGVEAAILARELEAEVIGIDLAASFDPAAGARVDLRRGDATCLDFANGYFDFVYSYHALEHIPEYTRALAEMQRVLSKGGGYWIGTPNRFRLIGYLGSKDTTWRDKVAWNIADWEAQLLGRFRNEYGAHAGFSSDELKASLAKAFGQSEEITLPYYRCVYREYTAWVNLLDRLDLGSSLFPSVYFMGRK